MVYKATSPNISAAIDKYRTGHYGEDEFRDEDFMSSPMRCDTCGSDVDGIIYKYDGGAYCEECFKERLFEDYADVYGEDI